MAVFNSATALNRLKSLIPAGWFADVAPYRDIVFGGLADSLSWASGLADVVRLGMRRATTTGWLMDVDAFAFFGANYLRRPGETDGAWGSRWRAEVFRRRVTRSAIDKALFDLTGRHPIIRVMATAADAGGGYGSPTLGYGVAGHYGSLAFPFQLFITAYRPMQGTIPNVGGYGTSVSGYGAGNGEYADLSFVQSTVSDAEIYATVNRVVAGGITAWVNISS